MRKTLVLALIAMTSVMVLHADTINGSATANWQSWTTATLNSDGNPFWDGNSWDGAKKNIGWCMAGGGNCTITPTPGTLNYWGTLSGGADTKVYFTNTGSAKDAPTLQIEIAGNANYNSFGWASITFNNTGFHIGPGNQIFSGPDGAGKSVTFTPTTNYVFYMAAPNGDVYYTYGSGNVGDAGTQHFAIFNAGGGAFYLGIEDLRLNSSDRDYNDMVIKVSDVPEPTSLVLLGSGLFTAAGAFRRKFLR
jgi:hypothetical protein